MSMPLMSTIYGWGALWAPKNWALCEGQLLPIAQMTALFSLLENNYGGDGRTTFALPDLRGRMPVNHGHGPGLTNYPIGARTGSERRTLTLLDLPSHSHSATTEDLAFSTPAATTSSTAAIDPLTPGANVLGELNADLPPPNIFMGTLYADASKANTSLAEGPVTGSTSLSNSGGNQYFSIIQPIQAISYIIALAGVYPSRS
ncbi:phage tail protein [Rhodospirillum sp. A1_3_36]|uniref:phage tail protein n=1 Tax=Rhodospirillum sp. A1_3_36 TaxID=3391666 RepID=UPI0039A479BA